MLTDGFMVSCKYAGEEKITNNEGKYTHKRERRWVASDAGEEEMVSQVHREADAALTSQSPSSQAKECLCAFYACVFFSFIVCLCICRERDTGVSHPAGIELAEVWLDAHWGKGKVRKKAKYMIS